MKARLVAVGERGPDWVATGYAEYAKRLSHWLPLELHEITPGRRGKGLDPARAIADEGARVMAAIPKGALVVALEVKGQEWTTEDLSRRLGERRCNEGRADPGNRGQSGGCTSDQRVQ